MPDLDSEEVFVVRFQSWERYDPFTDERVVQLQAVTDKGTFLADVAKQNYTDMRKTKEAFKDYVLQCMASKIDPHEVEIG